MFFFKEGPTNEYLERKYMNSEHVKANISFLRLYFI